MRVVSPAMTRVWAGEGRTPRTAQPMARMTVSKLQAAEKSRAAASMENHSMGHLRSAHSIRDTNWRCPGWFFQGGCAILCCTDDREGESYGQ